MGKKPSMFVFQKQKETFEEDEIPIIVLSPNSTTKPSELPSAPANGPNKVLTTPLEAGTENETSTCMTPNTRKQKNRPSTQLT